MLIKCYRFKMIRVLAVMFLSLFLSINAYASKFSAKLGDTVENEVSFGKDKFPLPTGKFLVAASKKWLDFRDVLLVQIDEDTGIIRWKIKLTATGNKSEKYSTWLPGEICELQNGYFLKVKKGSQKFACWLVESSDSEPKQIIRKSISNNYFSFGNTIYHKTNPSQGIAEKTREFESQNNIKLPDMFVVNRHQYAKKARLYESEYYYNPEVDGKTHKEFLKDYISISASLIDRFNKLNKVKGNFTLDASSYITQASTNQINDTKKTTNENKSDLINQIKSLKELLDAGAITQDEFDKAKKKILN
jgi:hypothetical protein